MASAETRIDLNRDWTFRIDPEGAGERSGWHETAPHEAERVDVPHTLESSGNIMTTSASHGISGTSTCRNCSRAERCKLNFGATFYRARIWINGVEVGGHEGGFTAYSFDITDHLRKEISGASRSTIGPGCRPIPGFGARGDPRPGTTGGLTAASSATSGSTFRAVRIADS